MTISNKVADKSVTEAVYDILTKAQNANEKIPTLRVIRATVGRGSLSTISEAVKEWRLEQLQSTGTLPTAFTPENAKAVSDAVWAVVQPILAARAGDIQSQADRRIELEAGEAAKIREAAEEMLAEANSKEETLKRVQQHEAQLMGSVAQLQGALDEARSGNARLQAANAALHKELDEAIKEAAAAKAALVAFKDMLPFVDAKQLPKLSK